MKPSKLATLAILASAAASTALAGTINSTITYDGSSPTLHTYNSGGSLVINNATSTPTATFTNGATINGVTVVSVQRGILEIGPNTTLSGSANALLSGIGGYSKATVEGVGARWYVGNNLTLGNTAAQTPTLTVANGGAMSVAAGTTIGSAGTRFGHLILQGNPNTPSTYTFETKTLNLGGGSQISMQGGATLDSYDTTINGTVDLLGVDTTWTVNDSMKIIRGNVRLGSYSRIVTTGTTAAVSLNSGASLSIASDANFDTRNSTVLNVGGDSTILVNGSLQTNNTFLYGGSVPVKGSTATWAESNTIAIYNGSTLDISDGAAVSTYALGLSEANSSITLTGNNSSLSANYITLGETAGGTQLNINAGARVKATDISGLSSDNTLTLNGGTLAAASLQGSLDGFIWTSGTVLLTGHNSLLPDVPSTGTLGGTGTLFSTPLTVNGALAPGMDSPADAIGTLSIFNSAFTIADNATLNFDFDDLSADLVTDSSYGNSTLLLGDGITLNLITDNLPTSARFITLFSEFGNIQLGDLSTWTVLLNGSAATFTWDTSDTSRLSLTLNDSPAAASVPLPTAATAALALLAPLSLTRRRR